MNFTLKLASTATNVEVAIAADTLLATSSIGGYGPSRLQAS